MNQENPAPYEGTPPSGPPIIQALARPTYRPYVTYILIGICVVMFLLQIASQYLLNADIITAWGVKANTLIEHGQFWRLITPIFLHGSIIHIGFNMYAMFVLGPGLEKFYGRWRFLTLFMLGGFAGNVMSFIFSPELSLGASTAIFGLLGAEGVLVYQNREIFGPNARRALSQVVMIAAINLVIGLSPGIDNWGHIGGLIGGSLFAWFAGPVLQRQGIYPNFTLSETRTQREVILAGAGVGALFAFLTIAVIYMRVG